MREAQAYLTRKLRERDLGRDLEGAKINLNEYLDRWLETALKPRVREKNCQDYEVMLRRYIRPKLGERVLVAMRSLDLETTYQQMIERGLSARTVRYTHVVLRSALGQALRWHFCCSRTPPMTLSSRSIPEAKSGCLRWSKRGPSSRLLWPPLMVQYSQLALTTGMRPSEYLGLKWQDINSMRQTVRSLQRLNGRWCFTDTRRSRSRRLIKLQNWIVVMLCELSATITSENSCLELRTSCSKQVLDSRSMPTLSRNISRAFLNWPACRGSDCTAYGTHQRR